jgi:hypothetical protein
LLLQRSAKQRATVIVRLKNVSKTVGGLLFLLLLEMLRCRPLQQQWHSRLIRRQLQPQRLMSQINEVASRTQSESHGPVAVYDKLVQEGTVIRDPHQVETLHMLQVCRAIESIFRDVMFSHPSSSTAWLAVHAET